MYKKDLLLTISIFLSMLTYGQTWTFDNMSLNTWATHRLDESFTSNSVVLTTKGQNNPRLDQASAAINGKLNKYAIVKMKVETGGPTLLRVNFNGGFRSIPITIGTTGFITYTFNMTDSRWSGTENLLELAFKDNDGTNGGATHNSDGVDIEIEEISFVENIYGGLTELYLDLDNGNDNNIGSSTFPLKSISHAINIAAVNNIPNVYIKSGTYSLTSTIDITASAITPITLSPEPNGTVKINLGTFRNFRFYNNAKNIEIKGLELDGNSNTLDHWTLLSEYLWLPETLPNSLSGGGICFQIEESEDIKLTDNVIHDFYQKAINIENGRYVKIEGNIIFKIGQTSLSGGHGIMRQQGSGSFAKDDVSTKYRWDIDGNLIFNVHQRIYSWVPSKGYLNMTLDEGKSILIDETPDHDTGMKARIRNNIVAFSKIDAIRLKPTNGLEVLNNSVYTKDAHANGISNTVNDFNSKKYGDPFLNFQCSNNAVEVIATKKTYDLAEAVGSTGSSFSNNYSAIGSFSPSNIATSQASTLFNNPDKGNFSLSNTGLTNVGVSTSVISELKNRASTYNVTVANNNWEHDHLKNTQTMLDNIPGLEDGVNNNEAVFTDTGTYDASDLEFDRGRKAYYFTINSVWQSNNIDKVDVLDRGNGLDQYDDMYEIVTPIEYSDWYDKIKVKYLRDTNSDGVGDTVYDRIRYGASVVAQNKILQDNSLHVVEIENATEYTVTKADENNITLAGDILIHFDYSPNGDEVFDLIVANNITNEFDNIKIEGYTDKYTLEVVTESSKEILRLTLISSKLSIIDFTKNKFVLYPNPSKSNQEFYLSAQEIELTKANVTLYNILGQEISLINSGNNFKPTRILDSGIYFIKIKSETTTLKWIID